MDQFSYRISGLRIGVILTILFSATSAWAESPDMRMRKKLIATGWDHPDSQRLLANLAAMEKQPFDGVVIELTGHTDEGKSCPLSVAFSNQN